MKLLFKYMGKYKKFVFLAIMIKFLGTVAEFVLPYILEHLIDNVVPMKNLTYTILWGLGLFASGTLCWLLNVLANRLSVQNAHNIIYDIRQRLFEKTLSLSGSQFDHFTLHSIISRMTSDSYNVQTALQQFQTLVVRAPILLIGGIIVSMIMDFKLSLIMIAMLPILFAVVMFISIIGVPLFKKVQSKLDEVVRIMRENITGIRVVKALSKEDYEKKRYSAANRNMTVKNITASTVMAIPGPFLQMCLFIGLTAIVYIGASRVNAGLMKPGVILAFLTYVNMVVMGVMGISRIFTSMSQATASADRINDVMEANTSRKILTEEETTRPETDSFIVFENVCFRYGEESKDITGFVGEKRENALDNICFDLKKGESLGIIGPTGCGKTTIISLLMRFYDVNQGHIYLDGKDIRCYDCQELRKRFGTVFQNDLVFQDTLANNITFGRNVSQEELDQAVADSMSAEFVNIIPEKLDYMASIKGANLSGGQKQRILVARALAADPEILVLDDSSSALDYKTDAKMRNAILSHHDNSTLIVIAQRISSIMNMDKILVMDNGRIIGYGTHEQLLKDCEVYKETFDIQMGSME